MVEQSTQVPGTVLVIGSTGRVGRHVVDGLLAAGVTVRALVRNASTAALPAEVELYEGELGRPATVARAAEGTDAAFLLWMGFDAAGAGAVVDALASRVRHVVYLSAARLQEGESGVSDGVWAEVERLVERSGVDWTFVRAGGFAANTLGWAARIRDGEPVRTPYARGGRSLVHERDIAEVIVCSLLDSGHAGRVHVVTGPETITQVEQAQAIGAAIGRPIGVEEQPYEEAHAEFADALGSDYADAALAHWATLVERPERATDDVERITGRPARSFAEWARDHAADFTATDHQAAVVPSGT